MATVVAGAAAVGALIIRFGSLVLPSKNHQLEAECARQILAELTEIRKTIHTQTRYTDDLRQEVSHLRKEVSHLRTEMAETKGMLR